MENVYKIFKQSLADKYHFVRVFVFYSLARFSVGMRCVQSYFYVPLWCEK